MFHQLPSLNAIKAFESAARLSSFKDAATELNVTPTAISHQIRTLEETLKVRLFERKTRAIALTDEGQLLAASANQSLQVLLTTVNQLKGSPQTLTISTTHSFAAMWLVPNLASFQQQYPNIDVQIRAEDTLIDIEHDRRVDMVIRYGEPPTKQHRVVPLVNESLGFFATNDYWKKQHDNDEKTVFFFTQWKNPDLPRIGINEFIQRMGQVEHPPITRYFNDENQTLQAVLSGQGIGLVSQLAVEASLKNGWVTQGEKDLAEVFKGLYYYSVIPARQQHNRALEDFHQWLCIALRGSSQPDS